MNHFEKINGLTYITLSGMQEGARKSMACTKTIRQWLPVKGCETLSSELTMDHWHDVACGQCFEFFAFHSSGHYATTGPAGAAENWRELCDGMTEIRHHYKWESVDFENALPHSNVRGGKKLKPIQPKLLGRVEQAIEHFFPSDTKSNDRTGAAHDWREHTTTGAMGLLGIESRTTLGKHAASPDYAYIERLEKRGTYRIDHSHPYVREREK